MIILKDRTWCYAVLVCVFLAMFWALPACAQEVMAVNPDRNKPLEITADQTLEWHRNEQQYIAQGNAVAKQGNVTIKADILTAMYRETEHKNMDIYRLTASGHVVILSQGNTAYGDKAVYNVDQGVAVMTGNNLKLDTLEQVVTARDSFEYWVTEGELKAFGKVRVVRGEDIIDADKMTAIFEENRSGQRKLKGLDADGHVVITTPDEILRGNKGRYRAATNMAELIGNVAITRGPNVLEGERAEVNLATNISKMFGGTGTNAVQTAPGTEDTGKRRVRGTFYPGSSKPDPSSSDVN